MTEENAPAGPLDSGSESVPKTEATPSAPDVCANCVKLIKERDKYAALLSEALDEEKVARTERNQAVKDLNQLVKAVAAGKETGDSRASTAAPPTPAPTGPAAAPKAPSLMDRIFYAPARVPGEQYDAWYAGRDKK